MSALALLIAALGVAAAEDATPSPEPDPSPEPAPAMAEDTAIADETVTFEVITFNTWGLPFPFSPGSRKERLEEASALFTERGADLIGLQELYGRSREHLPRAGYTMLPEFAENTGLALLSAWPVEVGSLAIFEPDRRGDVLTRKGFIEAHVTLPNGVILHVFVTHFDAARAYERRGEEAQRLLDEVAAERGPAVVMGDFNLSGARTDLAIGEIFAASGWRDIGAEGGPTHRMFDGRFDRIFLRDGDAWCLSPVEFAVLGPEGGARNGLSDHHPVWARLTLQPCATGSGPRTPP